MSDTPLLDRLAVGSRVAWHHGDRRLEGTVAAVVPAYSAPAAAARTLELPCHHAHYGGRSRGEDSFLVRVDEPGDPYPHLHWPWTWRLVPLGGGEA